MKRILSLLLIAPLACNADWFGPKSYEDCIIDGMKGTTSDAAAQEIKRACRVKFPSKQPEKTAISKEEFESISNLSRLEKDKYPNPHYNYIIRVHNNTNKLITGAKILVVAGNGELLYYKVDGSVPPFSNGSIFLTLDLNRLDEKRSLEWRYEEIYVATPL